MVMEMVGYAALHPPDRSSLQPGGRPQIGSVATPVATYSPS